MINGCDKVIKNYIKKDSIIRVPHKNMGENLDKNFNKFT